MSSVRVVRQVRPRLGCTAPAATPAAHRAPLHYPFLEVKLAPAQATSATSAAFISPARSYCIYYYVYLFYINLLLLSTERAPFSGLSIFIRALICYGFTSLGAGLLANSPRRSFDINYCVGFIAASILITAQTQDFTWCS